MSAKDFFANVGVSVLTIVTLHIVNHFSPDAALIIGSAGFGVCLTLLLTKRAA